MVEAVKTWPAIPSVGGTPQNVTVGKPPWSKKAHSGDVERLILQLGEGKGRFDEAHGIPRSMGCIGNNRFFLRRERLSEEEIRNVLRDFRALNGEEVWITNYDSPRDLSKVAKIAAEVGIPEVNVVVLEEDLDEYEVVEGTRTIVELEYDPDRILKVSLNPNVNGLLVMIPQEKLDEAITFLNRLDETGDFEIYADLLYPKSARFLKFNVIEKRMGENPTAQMYHDCLAGTIAVSADGYITPCPLLRNFVVGDVRKGDLRGIRKKKKLKEFWKMTKDKIEGCSACPLRYLCHDCRALEYQATGEIDGLEYCSILL
ncbi:SPASM domain-containing protein [Thermococcus waiotapuensis]|uniref:SPASM domain-containing protein n=1 Tax=Thermococcus waiotapuensis TaxID=90909 RepID=A0AAE4NTW4_9EURY|nr:SPASM domain-containing protein [Thermococcus waiotapuensis]MDV3103769.1 SPASM domain-containing protein [Thermococcus waiotapuensis]